VHRITSRIACHPGRVRVFASRTLIVFALILLGITGSAGATALAQSAKPSLRFGATPGYRLTVIGRGWSRRARLGVSLRSGTRVSGLELRATSAGSFKLGVNQVNLCGGVLVVVSDLSGHKAQVRGPALACPIPNNSLNPVLTILKGKMAHPRAVRILSPAAPTPLTMRIGETLYIQEPGTAQPSMSASADQRYLLEIGEGKLSSGSCVQSSCPGTFFWEWLAVRAGNTAIDLSPACRQTKPACGRPDIALEVHITR
jgi:hypothetical protein